jgi:hypothetical protein
MSNIRICAVVLRFFNQLSGNGLRGVLPMGRGRCADGPACFFHKLFF